MNSTSEASSTSWPVLRSGVPAERWAIADAEVAYTEDQSRDEHQPSQLIAVWAYGMPVCTAQERLALAEHLRDHMLTSWESGWLLGCEPEIQEAARELLRRLSSGESDELGTWSAVLDEVTSTIRATERCGCTRRVPTPA
ncbi:hypothetical protein [Embleya sp. NPDC059237]|uniref:hypothetical protein n=1 Tax=Embleya sp. NPDC059237 TaxID=3346784 RepID=UPI0036A672B1